MASETMNRLRAMAKQMPATDAKAATRAQEAQATQFQAGLAAAPAAKNITQQAQQAGSALVAAQGQTAAQSAAQSAQKTAQVGQAALQEQKFEGSQKLQKLERTQGLALGNAARQQALAGQEAEILSRKQVTKAEVEQAKRLQALGIEQDNRLSALTLKQREDLSKLGRDVKAKLFDAQLQFEKDERGRKFSNERQLMDYTIASTKDNIQLEQRMKSMVRDAERDLMMMEAMNNKLKQALSQKYVKGKQKLDQASKLKIKKAIEENERRIREKKAKAANRGMIITGAFTIAGAAVGAPMAGAAIGSVAAGVDAQNNA